MTTQSVMSIASSAIDIESQRISLIAKNIAHQNDITRVGDKAYKPSHLVSESVAPSETNFSQSLQQSAYILSSSQSSLTEYLPNHPLANKQGMVERPNIDTTQEMLLLMNAKRAYSANLKMFMLGRTLYNHALEIGGGR